MKTINLDASMIPLPTGYADASLGDSREAMRIVLALGESKTCQCCGGTAKVYARSLNKSMVRILQFVANSHGLINAEIMAQANPRGSGDTGKLAHFGLLDQDDQKRWHATQRGRDFLSGRIAVPARVLLYNNVFLGFDVSDYVHIDAIRGRAFDIDEVLSESRVAEAEVNP